MYKKRKKYYIPITRSGSSILASILTQAINQPGDPKPPGETVKVLLWSFVAAVIICLLIAQYL